MNWGNILNIYVQSNNESSNGGKEPKDWRKTLIGIALPTLIGLAVAFYQIYPIENKALKKCSIQNELNAEIAHIQDILNDPSIFDEDQYLIINVYKERFESYIKNENICEDQIELQKAKEELLYYKNINF